MGPFFSSFWQLLCFRVPAKSPRTQPQRICCTREWLTTGDLFADICPPNQGEWGSSDHSQIFDNSESFPESLPGRFSGDLALMKAQLQLTLEQRMLALQKEVARQMTGDRHHAIPSYLQKVS
jgi:hypothetical protein